MDNGNTCRWVYEEWDDYWEGDCGVTWQLLDNMPAENNMNYCPKCGRPLVAVIHRPELE